MSQKRGRRDARVPVGAGGARPMVAIVGRPNVGKSTLFNRLARQRIAIALDVPGVTRDRHYADAMAYGKPYVLIDTGGFDPEADDPMKEGISQHLRLALEECAVVVCVLDGSMEPTGADAQAVQLLRESDKPVLFVANKADSQRRVFEAAGLYELGVDRLYPVSALHGRGMGDLEEAIAAHLPAKEDIERPPEPERGPRQTPRLAIVGRPNAGKSSLLNRLLREDRQLVDHRPGTTVDSIDALYEDGKRTLVLIDTAGMRRKKNVGRVGVEALSVFQAIRAMERSHVVLLMVDAHAGVSEQDAKIAGLAVDRGRALVVGLNKVDLMDGDARKAAVTRAKEVLAFAGSWARFVTLSAKTGRGTRKLLEAIDEAVASHRQRVQTSEANRFFEEVLERHPPPSMKNRAVRLYYVTQAQIAPPTFVVVTNEPELVHFSYQRYVVNQLRARFGFEGTPIRVRYKGKRKVDLDAR
ncbi:MAG: ribosome biogenesis GTPase Der [Myxococcota bacterium]